MDFIIKLSRTVLGVDSPWVIVDHLTKSAHFISVQESISVEILVAVYIREVVARHVVPVSVVWDRDVHFTSIFWKRFNDELGTRLHFRATFYPQNRWSE